MHRSRGPVARCGRVYSSRPVDPYRSSRDPRFNLAEPIEATFTITPTEYVPAMRRHYRAKLQMKRDVIGGTIALGVGVWLLRCEDKGETWIRIASRPIAWKSSKSSSIDWRWSMFNFLSDWYCSQLCG